MVLRPQMDDERGSVEEPSHLSLTAVLARACSARDLTIIALLLSQFVLRFPTHAPPNVRTQALPTDLP